MSFLKKILNSNLNDLLVDTSTLYEYLVIEEIASK
jgi:hypothetical protein